LRNARRIEARRGLANASVQEVRVPLERDERVRVAGDRLDELDVGAGRHEARHAGVPQVMEAVALFGDLAALDRRRVAYVVIGSFARVVRGAEELPDGLDIVPSPRAENLRRLEEALVDLEAVGVDGARISLSETSGALIRATSPAGELKIVPEPEGTRGFDDLRRAATREPLGRGLRPSVASTGDLARMLAALGRDEDRPKLQALRQVAELERSLGPELAL
jgi:hypothetical protein